MKRAAWLVIPGLSLLLGDGCGDAPPPMAEPTEVLPGSAVIAWRATVPSAPGREVTVTKMQDGLTACYVVHSGIDGPATACVREAP